MKLKLFTIQCLLGLLLFGTSASFAQGVDIQFNLQPITGCPDNPNICVDIQVRENTGSSFQVGSQAFFFQYNTNALTNPVEAPVAGFDDGTAYTTNSTIGGGNVSIDIPYNGGTGNGTAIDGNFITVVSVCFDVADQAASPGLAFLDLPGFIAVFLDDNQTEVPRTLVTPTLGMAGDLVCATGCPAIATPIAASESFCEQGTPDLAAAQATLDCGGDCSDYTIAWFTDAAFAMPYDGGVLSHSTVKRGHCASETATLFAQATCTIDATTSAAGTLDVVLYPAPRVPEIVQTSSDATECTYEINPSCPDDVLSIGTDTLFTLPVGSPAGSRTITVTSGIAGTVCPMLVDAEATYDACLEVNCETIDSPIADTQSFCDQGVPDLMAAEMMLGCSNGDCSEYMIDWFLDPGFTMPYVEGDTLKHETVAKAHCAPNTVTLYAQATCTLNNNTQSAGTIDVVLYPAPRVPEIVQISSDATECTYEINPSCPDDVLSIGTDTLFMLPVGSPAGSRTITVTSGIAGTVCPMLVDAEATYDACLEANCETIDSPIADTQSFCDQGVPDLAAAEATLVCSNNNCSEYVIAWFLDEGFTMPYTTGDTVKHSTVAKAHCAAQTVTLYAQATCTLNSNAQSAGTIDVVLYPAPRVPEIVQISSDATECTYEINPSCPDDVLSIGTDTLFMLPVGSPAGSRTITVTSGIAGTVCPMLVDGEATYEACDGMGCMETIDNLIADTQSFCDQGVPDLMAAEMMLGCSNGDCSEYMIDWFLDPGFVTPYVEGDTLKHETVAKAHCATNTVTLYAQATCTANSSTQNAGTIDVILYPNPRAPEIVQISSDDTECTYEINPSCPDDVLSLDTLFTLPVGSPAGDTMITVTSGIAGSVCPTQDFPVTYEICQDPNGECTADAGAPTPPDLGADNTYCVNTGSPSDLVSAPNFDTLFTGNGADTYAYVITTSADSLILGVSNDGSFDFADSASTGMPYADGEYCVFGFYYSQNAVNNIAQFLNDNPALAGLVGIPAEALPLPIPLSLESLLGIVGGLLPDGLSIDGVLGAIDLLGGPPLNLSVCFDVSERYCFNVVNECDCADITSPIADTQSFCDQGIPDLAAAEATLVCDGNCGDYTIAWFLDEGFTMPYTSGDTVKHSTVAKAHCAAQTVTLYAQATCRADDMMSDAGTLDVVLYPNPREPEIVVTQGNPVCTYEVNPSCPDDVLSIDTLFTLALGTSPGDTTITVTSGIAGSVCPMLTFDVPYDTCGGVACNAITAPIAATESFCDQGVPDLMAAEATLACEGDDCSQYAFAWFLDEGFTMPYTPGDTVKHSTVAKAHCAAQTVTLYAQATCSLNSIAQSAGTLDVVLYPNPREPEIVVTQGDTECVYEVNPSCPDDVLSIDTLFTLPNPTNAGDTVITVTSGIAGSVCPVLTFDVPYDTCGKASCVESISDIIAATESFCDQGVPDLAAAEATLACTNDDCSEYSISWFLDVDFTTPYITGDTLKHETVAKAHCATNTITLYAQATCNVDQGTQSAGTLDVVLYPAPRAPEIVQTINGEESCTYEINPSCPNDVLSIGTDTLFTLLPGDPGGSVTIDVTSGIAGTVCPMITAEVSYDGCPAVCTPNAGEPTPPNVSGPVCQLPASPGFDVDFSGFGADTYSYVVTTEADSIIIGVSDDGSFNFADDGTGNPYASGNYCVTGFYYSQADLDAIGMFLNVAPQSILDQFNIPASAIPFPIPLALETLLDIVGGASEEGVSLNTVYGAIDQIGELGLGICFDVAERYCVEIDCADCPQTIDNFISGSESFCSSGTPDLQAAIDATLGCSGDCSVFDIDFFFDPEFTDPYDGGVIEHPAGKKAHCAIDAVTLYAQATCTTNGATQAAGSIDITIYPSPRAPEIIKLNDLCDYEINPSCPDDLLSIGTDTLFSFPQGEPAGTMSITVTSGVAGTLCGPLTFDVAYDACEVNDCPEVVVNPISITESFCERGTPDLAAATASLGCVASMTGDTSDCSAFAVNYFLDEDFTMPYDGSELSHSTAGKVHCNVETVTIYAQATCSNEDMTTSNAGTITVQLYAAPRAPIVEVATTGDSCTYVITPSCDDDVITGMVANQVAGADSSVVTLTVANVVCDAISFEVTVPACPLGCPAEAGVPVAPTDTYCTDNPDSLSLTVTEFSTPTSGTTDYTYVVTNAADSVIVGLAPNGEFDFSTFPAGDYCFTGFAFNQAEIDAVGTFINDNPSLAGVIGVPAEALPLPLPLDLQVLLDIAAGFSEGGLTIQGVLDAFDLLGTFNISLCFDLAEEPYCVSVQNCNPACNPDDVTAAVDMSIDGVVANGSVTGSVVVTSPDDCELSASVQWFVNGEAVVGKTETFAYTYSIDTICGSETITLTAEVSFNGALIATLDAGTATVWALPQAPGIETDLENGVAIVIPACDGDVVDPAMFTLEEEPRMEEVTVTTGGGFAAQFTVEIPDAGDPCDDLTAGTVSLEGGGDGATTCAGDGIADVLAFAVAGASDQNFAFVVTDADGNILAIADANTVDFEGAGPGACLVYGVAFVGDLSGDRIDNLTADCVAVSANAVTVNRSEAPDASTVAPFGFICNDFNEGDATLNLNGLVLGDNGGTWSGEGVTGNTFNGDGLAVGDYEITYTVTGDAPCGEVSSTQIISVVDCNMAPIAPAELEVLVLEGSGDFTFNIIETGNIIDPENDPITVVPDVQVIPGVGTITVAADGTITFTPEPGFNTSTTITVVVQDPTNQVEVLLTITVTPCVAQAGTLDFAGNTSVFICPELVDGIQVAGTGFNEDFAQWYILVDDNGSIVAIDTLAQQQTINEVGEFDSPDIGGTYAVYAINFDAESGFNLPRVGDNIDDVFGQAACFAVSEPLANLIVLNPIEITSKPFCDPTMPGVFFSLINITGGFPEFSDVGSYEINWPPISIPWYPDSSFASAVIGPIPLGASGYSIDVTNDGNLCETLRTFIPPMECPTDSMPPDTCDLTVDAGTTQAGILFGGGNADCLSDDITVAAEGINLGTQGYVLGYFVHPDPALDATMILAANTTGTFSLADIAGGQVNTEYYVSAAVGPDNDGDGLPDLNDPCTVVSIVPNGAQEGTPIVFLTPITISADAVCDGNAGLTYNVLVTINGGLPAFDGSTYSIEGVQAEQGILTNATLAIGPLDAGTSYVVTAIDGLGCATTVSGEADCKLPIELLSFAGEAQEAGNLITWVTASEVDNDRFELLRRSANSNEFELIATIDGNGTTALSQSYSFLDKTVEAGISYYQLRQVDYSGESQTYGPIAIVRGEIDFGVVAVSPVPVVEYISIDFVSADQAEVVATIYDIQGRMIDTQTTAATAGVNNLTIDVVDLASGMYFLSITDGAEVVNTKFVKK